MNLLSRDTQIAIIAALCEGVGQRAVSRLTGTDRKTVARLALAVGRGCAELHDRMMVGLRVHRIECDELWAYVGHKRTPQKSKPRPSPVFGDQYTYVALASSTRAIIGYLTAHGVPRVRSSQVICACHINNSLSARLEACGHQ